MKKVNNVKKMKNMKKVKKMNMKKRVEAGRLMSCRGRTISSQDEEDEEGK